VASNLKSCRSLLPEEPFAPELITARYFFWLSLTRAIGSCPPELKGDPAIAVSLPEAAVSVKGADVVASLVGHVNVAPVGPGRLLSVRSYGIGRTGDFIERAVGANTQDAQSGIESRPQIEMWKWDYLPAHSPPGWSKCLAAEERWLRCRC
jgi:hypothetical protein